MGKKEEAPITPPANAKIAKFGPDNCVSTWRDQTTAHCIVKTDCTGQNTTDYTFGLVCDGSAGPVRHLFGKDSFEAVETFDTLIPCTDCLALDAVPEDVEVAQEISDLGDSIKGMKTDMTELEADVTKLNKKVLGTEATEKKEEAAPAPAPEAAEDKKDLFFMKERNRDATDNS